LTLKVHKRLTNSIRYTVQRVFVPLVGGEFCELSQNVILMALRIR